MSLVAFEFLQHFGLQDIWIQTFDDKKSGNKKALSSRRCFNAADSAILHDLNIPESAGIYFCVNRLKKGHDRNANNVAAVRAFFVDLDGAPLQPVKDFLLQPNLIVQTSRDRYQAYWLLRHELAADKKLFKGIQLAIANKFSGDRAITDLCRVMRLPGFYNMKKEPWLVRYEKLHDHRYSLQEVKDAFNWNDCALDDCNMAAAKGSGDYIADWANIDRLRDDCLLGNKSAILLDCGLDEAKLRGALLAIPSDEYSVWINVGLCLAGSVAREDLKEEDALKLWAEWSALSDKYDETLLQQKWQGLNSRGECSIGSIFEMAKAHGWNGRRADFWTADEWLESERKRLGIK